jgi:thiosulfate reductase cytochrome b subunit
VAAAASPAVPGFRTRNSDTLDSPRHSAFVRLTHWINTLSFFGLLVSGIAILVAHPRFYWGEAGGVGTPSIFDLPLPFMKGGPSGWGRNLHFLSAWVCVLNGLFYAVSGILTGHFRRNLLPAKADFTWRSIFTVVETSLTYNPLQRLTYLVVVFVLFPLMLWTGLAMSPAIISVLPGLVTILGGKESARTIHFFAADFLVLFLLVHITMVSLAGFGSRVRAMILGRNAAREERA